MDNLINKVVDVDQLQAFLKIADKTFEGVFDQIGILKYLLEDEETIYFPLHERQKLYKDAVKRDIFERIKQEKSVYDQLEAERQKARFLKQQISKPKPVITVQAPPKKIAEFVQPRVVKLSDNKPTGSISVSRYGQSGGFISSVKLGSAFSHNYPHQSIRTPLETEQVQVERLTEDPEDMEDGESDISWRIREAQINRIKLAIKSLRVVKDYEDSDISHIKKLLLMQEKKSAIERSKKAFELKDARLLSQIERAPYSVNFDIKLETFKDVYGKVLKQYQVDDELLIDAVWSALEYSQPIRNKILPLFCPKDNRGYLDTFRTPQENSLKYPLEEYLRTSFWTKNSSLFPESAMRDYFGEKSALYFGFLAFYRDELVYPVIVGLVQNIIIIVYFAADVPPVGLVRFSADWYIKKIFQWSSFAFAGYMVVWAKRVVFLWEGYEDNFRAKYSIKTEEENEDNLTVRTNFKGVRGRNIVTDLMNETYEKKWTLRIMQTIICIFVLGSVALTIFCSWAIIQWKRDYFVTQLGSLLPPEGKLSLIITPEHFFTMIEFLRVKAFEWLYFKVIAQLILWKNLKFKEKHEGELIVCLSLFELLNNAAFLLIVGFETLLQNNRQYASSDEVTSESRCTNLSCSDEIIKFYLMFMVMAVGWTIGWKLVISKLIDKLREYSNKAVKSLSKLAKQVKNSFHKKQLLKAVMVLKKKKVDQKGKNKKELQRKDSDESEEEQGMMDRVLYIHHRHPEKFYNDINEEIDYQVKDLQTYKASEDFNQELFDYLEIFNLHSFLALFGVLFPIVFVIGLVITLAEWKMDLNDLIRGTKRPVPVETGSIGVWLNMMRLVSILAACTNTFFVAFILFEQSSFYDKLGLFLLSSICLLTMIFVWDHQYKPQSVGGFIAVRAGYIKSFLMSRLEKRIQLSKDVPNVVLKKEVQKEMRIFGTKQDDAFGGVDVFSLAEQVDLQIQRDEEEKILKTQLEEVFRDNRDMDHPRKRLHLRNAANDPSQQLSPNLGISPSPAG